MYVCMCGSLFLVHLYTDALAPCHSNFIWQGTSLHVLPWVGFWLCVFNITYDLFPEVKVQWIFSKKKLHQSAIVSTHYYTLPIPPTMPFILYSFHKVKTSYFTTKKKKKVFKWESPQLSFIPFVSVLTILPSFPASFLSLGRRSVLSFLLSRSYGLE